MPYEYQYVPPSREKMAYDIGGQKLAEDHPFRKMTKEQRLAQLEKGRATQAKMRAEGIKVGGRPSKKEARRVALTEMEPRALQVLRERMESLDERISMQAAMKVLEYTQGKPSPEVRPKEEAAQIVYESAVADLLKNEN